MKPIKKKEREELLGKLRARRRKLGLICSSIIIVLIVGLLGNFVMLVKGFITGSEWKIQSTVAVIVLAFSSFCAKFVASRYACEEEVELLEFALKLENSEFMSNAIGNLTCYSRFSGVLDHYVKNFRPT